MLRLFIQLILFTFTVELPSLSSTAFFIPLVYFLLLSAQVAMSPMVSSFDSLSSFCAHVCFPRVEGLVWSLALVRIKCESVDEIH